MSTASPGRPADDRPLGPSVLLGETVVLDDVGRARRGRPRPSLRVSTALLLPAAAAVGAFVLYPVARTVFASVTGPQGGFLGLEHFRTLVGREDFWPTFRQTIAWAVVVPALVTLLGWVLATASRRLPSGRIGAFVVLATLAVPIALPFVVTGTAFRLLADPDPDRGLTTRVLGTLLGNPESPPALLGPRLVTVWLMAAFVWAWLGLAVVVFRRALDRLPPVLAETVRAHGGNRWAVFRHALWHPLLRRTSAILFTLVALATVRAFDLILMAAPGSVVDEAAVLPTLQWHTSRGETTGPAAALGVIWLLLAFSAVLLAALGSRQAWPAPTPLHVAPTSRSTLPAPTPLHAAPTSRSESRSASPEVASTRGRRTSGDLLAPGRLRRVALRVAAPALAAVWAVPLLALVATSLHAPADAKTRSWWDLSPGGESYDEAFGGDGWLALGLVLAVAAVFGGACLASSRRLVRSGPLLLVVAIVVTSAMVVAEDLADDDLVRSAALTFVLASVVAGTVLVVALLAAYALAWIGPPGAHIAGVVLLAVAVVPVLVIAGPIREVMGALRLTTTPLGLGLVHIAFGLPVAVFVLRNALADLPPDEVRQARLTERSELRVMRRLARTKSLRVALVAVLALEFVQVWNDFVVGLLFGGADAVPLTVLVQSEADQFVTRSGPLAATAVVASLVPVAIVVLGHRWIVAGLIGGSEPPGGESARPETVAP